MKSQTIICALCTAVLVMALLAAGCTSSSAPSVVVPTPTAVPTTAPTAVPTVSSCGLTNCHGLDVSCGMNAPQVCTAMYQVGDRCRKYARCDTSNGGCALVLDAGFASCKACVQRCEIGAGSDNLASLSCEEQC
jgi:hypothetical protein